MRIDKINHNIYFLASLSLIGILTLLFATREGIGISPDSTVYIDAARNLLAGNGLTVFYNGELLPLTHYPPLFPAILSMIGILGIEPLTGARYINAFLFGANILLAGIMINKCTNDSFWFPIFGSLLILISDVVLNIHSVAWSEPLFIFFGFLGLFILSTHIEKPKLSLLIISSIAIALAFLTRYIGITLLMTGVAGIILLCRETYYKRIADSIIFLTVSSLPIIIWSIRNLYIAGSATNREIVFHPISLSHVKSAFFHISIWLFPSNVPTVIRVISLAVVILLIFVMIQKLKRQNMSDFNKRNLDDAKLLLLSAFILIYVGFLIISISFIDAQTPLDNRILSPVYVSGLILTMCQTPKLFHYMRKIHFLKIVSIFIAAFAISYLIRGAIWVINNYGDGQGYASKAWRESKIIQKIITLPREIRVYTNAPEAIYILTGKSAYWIPIKTDQNTLLPNDSYLSDMAKMRGQLKNRTGILVYFNTIKRLYLPSEEELKQQFPLHLAAKGADGAIYEIEP